jgi:aminopeptidase
MNDVDALQRRYAELIVRVGLNLQYGQSVLLTSELVHRDFTVLVVEACYKAGAQIVEVRWREPLTARARLEHAGLESLDAHPSWESARYRALADERWTAVWLTGEEIPGVLDSIDPARISRAQTALGRINGPFSESRSANRNQWTIAAVPTPAWARRVFPEHDASAGVAALWEMILKLTRADQPDPVAAWQAHIGRLQSVGAYLMGQEIRGLRFYDPMPARDGRASTDLTVGLTPTSFWETAAFKTPEGLQFVANIPSEEIFTTPHRMQAHGWVRTSRPIYPLNREVRGAYFRFEDGEVVEASSETGEDALRTFLEIPGTRRLGEVALVDQRSPLTQTSRVFFDDLYDENAACHIAFGDSLLMCVSGIDAMDKPERVSYGLNDSDMHEDFMIGTPTMNVFGVRADGATVDVMRDGQFVSEATREQL